MDYDECNGPSIKEKAPNFDEMVGTFLRRVKRMFIGNDPRVSNATGTSLEKRKEAKLIVCQDGRPVEIGLFVELFWCADDELRDKIKMKLKGEQAEYEQKLKHDPVFAFFERFRKAGLRGQLSLTWDTEEHRSGVVCLLKMSNYTIRLGFYEDIVGISDASLTALIDRKSADALDHRKPLYKAWA